ncbi:MAG: Crp/Fnr family transcriptional regulator [Leptospiraceae bacterium]|nr:Crp/Fnr family transcriptional regulator [Leptospiraceae bacterium]
MQAIRSYFDKLVKLNDLEFAEIVRVMKKVSLSKKEFLLNEGEVCDFVAFIEKGVFRYHHEIEGEEKVIAFFFEREFVSNYRSFLTGQPSEYYIQALEESEIWIIRKADLMRLYDKFPKIDRLGRFIAERLFLAVTARLDSFLFSSPEDRFQSLIKQNPALFERVPQYMIASFLGVTPESLSRIRTRVTGNY